MKKMAQWSLFLLGNKKKLLPVAGQQRCDAMWCEEEDVNDVEGVGCEIFCQD